MKERYEGRKERARGERDLEREEGKEGNNKASLGNFFQVTSSGGKTKEGNDAGNRVVGTYFM